MYIYKKNQKELDVYDQIIKTLKQLKEEAPQRTTYLYKIIIGCDIDPINWEAYFINKLLFYIDKYFFDIHCCFYIETKNEKLAVENFLKDAPRKVLARYYEYIIFKEEEQKEQKFLIVQDEVHKSFHIVTALSREEALEAHRCGETSEEAFEYSHTAGIKAFTHSEATAENLQDYFNSDN